MRLFGWLEVGGAVSEEAGGADGFGEDDADGDEDGAGSGREGDSDFDASALGIFIAAAKSDAALGKIFARLRRGMTRSSSCPARVVGELAGANSDCASIQTDGASQTLQMRAIHLRDSKDFSSSSFR